MEQRIKECLAGNEATEYILPFFWQHGEEHEVLAEEIDAIYRSGIREFCVESRTHEQFGEDKWWEDFAFLLKEAERRDMRVWLLDDKLFPTGYANNYIASHPELRAVRLRMEFRDFAGPRKDVALLPIPLDEDESYVSIVAYERKQSGDLLVGEGISLMPEMKDGLIWLDIPEGCWRVYYVIRTRRAGFEERWNFIDMMSEESCKAMLHAVYEPHYEHFRQYFGNTFAGFFSDEPAFMNEDNYYDGTLGREDVVLPWNDSLPKILAEKSGLEEKEILLRLPALWHDIERYTSVIREVYMEAVTEAYSENFSQMLGDWCRERNVLYIGHIIEDQNAHQRLGRSAGHFFRALKGQDMSGCDIVLHQLLPGLLDFEHTAALTGNRAEPAFFNYMLPKLASSQAHIEPLKKGRAMCEVYGAFGWATGIPGMKYITDLMLVSGINHFVPHAFTPKYPDHDCPPHFYARGQNPQFLLFGELMRYTQRVSHVLSGGIHQASVAVYYNAEAEWAGGKRMLQQEVCRELTRKQMDFDLIPQDILCGEAWVKEGQLCVHEESYDVLIVPYSQYLPDKLLRTMGRMAEEGLKVWFINDYPEASSEQHSVEAVITKCEAVLFSELTAKLMALDLQGIQSDTECPSLRYFHVKRDGQDVFMLWNEDIFKEMDTQITFPVSGGKAVFYDAWNNMLFKAEQKDNTVRVQLAPSEAIILYFDEEEMELPDYDYGDGQKQELELDWKISLCGNGEAEFKESPYKELKNLARELPKFSGIIRYESEWEIEEPELWSTIEFSEIGETAQLWINDVNCGAVVAKPYRFAINGKLKNGKNLIRIEVISNLAYRERDEFSTYLPLPLTGIVGPVYRIQK